LKKLLPAVALTALFWPALRGVEILGFRDMLHNYGPMKELFWGSWALWNDHAFGGSSLLPDLVEQPFYLPNLVFRLFHAHAWPGIAVYLWLHGLLGLWGAWALARRFVPAESAAMAAAAFALCGFSIANASNLQWACAAAWAPVVLFAALDLRPTLLALSLPQPLLAGDPLLCALLFLAAFLLAFRKLREHPRQALFVAATALLLLSPQLVATLRALPSMTRAAGFALAEREQWSLHPARLFELFVPRLFGPLFGDGFWGGFTVSPPWKRSYIHSIYSGVASPALALLAVRQRSARPWLLLALATLAFALGDHFFHLYGLVTSLPVLKAFRYPERLLALFVPAWAVLLAVGADRLFKLPPPRRALLLAGSAGFALAALALTALFATPDRAAVSRSALQIAAAGTACIAAVLLPRGAPLALLAVLTVDLCAANAELLGLLPRFREEPAVCAALDRASGGAARNSFRVYVDQERLERGGAFREQREREYNFGKRNLLEQCGFRESASLTSLDPRAERELWNRGPLLLLRALGTRFVVTAPGNANTFGARERLTDAQWSFAIDEIPEIQPLIFRAAPEPAARLLELHDSPGRLDFRAVQAEPGYWILAFTLDQDWRAEIDGSPAALGESDLVRRTLWLPKGEHRVTLRYRPGLLLALFGFSLLLHGLLALYASRRTPGAAI
jgi:hypothetical protein